MATKKKTVKPVVIEVAEEVKPKKKYDGRANLKPVRTKSEAKERGRAGGLKSGEARRTAKTFQQILKEVLTDDKRIELLEAMQKKALHGDTKAFELLRDTLGEKPVEQTQNINLDVSYEDYMKKLNEDKEW